MNNLVTGKIEDFKKFVARWKDAYKHAIFSYIAFKNKEGLPTLYAGTVKLLPVTFQL